MSESSMKLVGVAIPTLRELRAAVLQSNDPEAAVSALTRLAANARLRPQNEVATTVRHWQLTRAVRPTSSCPIFHKGEPWLST